MSERLQPTRDGCWLDWGGNGPPLHFAHSNGFPPQTLRRLFEGYGHCLPMENPKGVGESILRFAAEVSG